MNNKVKLYNSARYPTSIIIRGADELGIEMAKSLLEQGGYVIIVDDAGERTQTILSQLDKYKLLTILDYSAIEILESELRRLDYVFYFEHKASNLTEKISSQAFLQNSNYLDTILDLSTKFEAKFLLTTSIKAHQMNVGNKQIDINYSADNEDKHSTYTELEIQRYSESLVKEYQEKVGLDARIIRLGIILGRSFDPEEKSILYKLITNALRGQDLLIPGDGLDTDYYVHYLDAAYGLIKAQFSLNTAGKTFSLCNEEQQSILSIAYKLLEIVPDAQDIKFDQDDNDLLTLKLYKPSDNLSVIGWKPRVSFDRALAQTIDEVKNIQNTNTISNFIEKQNIDAGGNNTNEILSPETQPQDALSKLISERKTQQSSRMGGIILANKNVKERERSERNKGFFRRLDIGFNNILFALKRRMTFLKNMTVTDFIAWLLIIVAVVIIYFVLLAPGISLITDLYQIKNAQNDIEVNLNLNNYEEVNNQSTIITSTIKDAQLRLSDLRYVFNILNSDEQYKTYQKILDDYVQLIEGLQLATDSLIPYQDYLESFEPNITYRYADNTIVTVGSNSEYDEYLLQMKNKYNSLKIGVDKATKAIDTIAESESLIPAYISEFMGLDKQNLTPTLENLTKNVNLYNYLPALVGYQQSRNYLFVVQDNARYTAAGGEIAGYIIVQFRNGAIKDIRVKTATEINSSTISISKDAVDEIKLMASVDKSATDMTFKDLGYINNQKLFLSEVEAVISNIEDIKIDMITAVNIKYLESMISVYGSINYKEVIFTQENLLDRINSSIDTTNSLPSRNEIIMNLYASGIEKAFNNMNFDFQDLVSITGQSIDEYNLKYYSTDPVFSSLSLDNPLFSDKSHADYIIVGTNYNTNNVLIAKYPVNTVVASISVLANSSTEKEIEISTDGIENLENNYLCIPAGSKQVELNDILPEIVSRTYTNDMVCYTIIKTQNVNYNINYETLPLVTTVQDSIYTFKLYSNTGLSMNYDLEFDFEPSMGRIEPINTDFILQGGKYIYTGRSTGLKEFSFRIINNE